MMTLQELKFILALAQERHFGKAARQCHVSQPTLSVALQKLEKELGVALFERDKNDIRVTSVGKDICERAKRVLAEVEGIKLASQTDKDQLQGVFKLGVIYTIGPYLLPAFITALSQLAPNMPIEIQEDFTGNLREKLAAGELDAIIISLPFTHPNVVTKPLYKEPFVVLMPAHHPLAKKTSIHQKELNPYNLLLLGEGHCFRDQIVASCPMCFLSDKLISWKTVAGSSLETIRHMVAANLGITILPETAALSGHYQSGILTTRPLKAVEPNRVVALAWRKSYPRVKAIDVLLQAAKKMDLF